MTKIDYMREAFEAWWQQPSSELAGHKATAWKAWQAAKASQQGKKPVDGKPLEIMTRDELLYVLNQQPDVADIRKLGAFIPCYSGGTFENDPPDAIIHAAIRYLSQKPDVDALIAEIEIMHGYITKQDCINIIRKWAKGE